MRRRQLLVAAGLLFLFLLDRLAANPAPFSPLVSLWGRSGKLRAVFTLPGETPAPAMTPAGAAKRPGIYELDRSSYALDLSAEASRPLHWFVLTPFAAKIHGRIGPYRIGTWPFERREPSDAAYANPRGFIEVTPANRETSVSEHFSIGQFLTKNQANVWPKYLVLQARLIDKLELTIEELNREGYRVGGLFVMSGFRTPDYNEPGVGAGGRSAISRHQYGDAADVYPDDRGRGRMDDLNHDGRVDLTDARILAHAAEMVEEAHPELAGGIGVYPATSVHGPFVHIDARGKRARWGA